LQPPDLVKVEGVDLDTELKVSYMAYQNAAGHEVKHGNYVMWYENGRKYLEATYDQGKLNGKCTIFSEAGEPEIVGMYHHGKPWNGEFQVGHEIRKYAAGKFMSRLTGEK